MTRGILCLLLVVAAHADEPVAVARLQWEAGLLGSASAAKITLAETPPQGLKVPAKLAGARFGKVDVGAGRKLDVAIHSKNAQLWLDANGNGDLRDERPLKIKPVGNAWNHTPTVHVGGEPLILYFYLSPSCKHDHVHFYPRMHRRGEVVLAKRLRPVGVADARFGGAVFVDGNGDGVLDETDRVEEGKPFGLRGTGYVAKLGSDAVEFRKAAEAPERSAPAWKPLTLSQSKAVRPEGTLAELRARYAKEKSGPAARRYDALRMIAGLHTEAACAFLISTSADLKENLSSRMQAASLLGNEAYRPYAARIIKALPSWVPAVQDKGLLALHFMGYQKREALYLKVLSSGTSIEVRGASQGLILLGRREPVHKAVRTASNKNVRYYAYQALRYDKTPPPEDLVRAAVADDYEVLAGYALEDMSKLALPGLHKAALTALAERPTSPALVRVCIEVLGRSGDVKAVRELLDFAGSASGDAQTRMRKEMGPIRDPDVTAIYIKSLRSKQPKTRGLAAALLAALPDRKTTDALIKRATREKDPAAIGPILEALGEHADPRSVRTLLSLAKRKDPVVRLGAIRALASIGPGLPAVQKFFGKLLGSSAWEDRVHALDFMGRAGDAQVLPRIVPNLDHKVWQVRHAAAEALGRIRVYGGIEPMIVRLGKEEHQRVRAALANALFRTTGQHFYDFADTWARWWAEKGAAFKVPEEIPVKRKPRPGGTVASFYGLPLDSGRVIFVVDQSGSMQASDAGSDRTRLQTALAETAAAIGRLKPRDKVNVIFFESGIHPWRQTMTPLTPANRKALGTYLASRTPMGGTNLYDGLELALKSKDVDTIFLLSDGAPGAGKFTATADIVREVGRLNGARRIAIHCVSIGTDSDLLKKLAAANGGKHVRR